MLVARHGLKHLSTGDLLRDHIKEGTELGQLAKAYMDKGQLVPDDVVIGMVRATLKDYVAETRFVLDGFPRTPAQAEALSGLLAELGLSMGRVVFLEVPTEVLVSRLAGRRICKVCGAVYHLKENPSAVAGICDKCGGELMQRSDDTEEVVLARLVTYNESTAPVKAYYREHGVLREIDGTGSAEEVYGKIQAVLF